MTCDRCGRQELEDFAVLRDLDLRVDPEPFPLPRWLDPR